MKAVKHLQLYTATAYALCVGTVYVCDRNLSNSLQLGRTILYEVALVLIKKSDKTE